MTGPAAVSYKRGTGEGMVYGGGFIGALSGLVALQSGVPLLGLLSLIAIGVAIYHSPMIGKGPALAFDSKALYVQGVGAIPWASIEGVTRADKPVRTLQNPILAIDLAADWQQSPLDYAPGGHTKFLRPAGRVKGNRILVPLEGLNADADQLTHAIENIWRNA